MLSRPSCPVRASVTLAVTCALAAPALAAPPDTVFIEDVHLHPSGPAELQLEYEHVGARESFEFDVELLAIRAAAGFDRAPLDFTISAGLGQPEGNAALLEHFGLRARMRVAGSPGEPVALVFAGYRRLMAADAVFLEQGAAVRIDQRSIAIGGELSARQVLGGEEDTQVELRAGAAVTYMLPLDYARLGVEGFALVPITGDRVSDLARGGGRDDIAIYVGPSLRMNLEYLWLRLGAATGALTSAGAPVIVRATLAAQF